ncbi:MAG: putative L,D-transpeptidase YkuD [Candidatus Dichloromethanomonas elyunquensis]|nr:MAG: putative L,D-transpeptidase YkuD [Candidatus Dichloromethanomonas elyunquensis]
MPYSIFISLSKKQLFLLRDRTVIKKYPIAIGKKQTPTPTGTYTVVNKVPRPGGIFGVYWLGLSAPEYGIHGNNNTASIGKEISSGCIRMYNDDVVELAGYISIGAAVTIRH